MFWFAALFYITLWDLATATKTANAKHKARHRSGTADTIYDFIAYLFIDDDIYYPGILITADIVVTYQVGTVRVPMICFQENCASHVRDSWSSSNLHFWQLTAKRPNPSIYRRELDVAECYVPTELGKKGFIEFAVVEDGVIKCDGSCASGDAIICNQDLYGMLTARKEGEDIFGYLSVEALQKMSGRPNEMIEDDALKWNVTVPMELEAMHTEKHSEPLKERRESLAAYIRPSFNLFGILLLLIFYYYG